MNNTAQSISSAAGLGTRSEQEVAGLFEFFRHHGVWAPGVRLFRRIDFKAKAAFISAAFAIPIAFLAWQFYLHGQNLREATQREIVGIEAMQHADNLLTALRAERLALLSGARPRPDLAAAETELATVRTHAARFAVATGLKAVEEANTALKGAAPPVDEQLMQTYIDAVTSLVKDLEDGSGLARDPDVDTYYLQSIVHEVVPEVLEALSHAQAIATQYQVKSSKPEGVAGHQLFAMTYWAAKHLVHVESMLERVKAVNPEGAARVRTKDAMEKVWDFAGNANAAWFGDKFVGSTAQMKMASEQAMKGMQDIRADARTVLIEALEHRIRRIDGDRYVVVAVLVAALSLSAYLFYSFFLVISGGLGEVRRHLVAMTDGDLTTSPRPWGQDEAAHLMGTLVRMQESLRSIVSRVRGSSESIVEASREIAAVSGDLSARIEKTATNLEESASSMEQVSVTVKQTAHNSREAAVVAQNNADVADRGGQVIGEVVTTMREIQASSKKIADIIGTIDGIAFQTNILALNAAVEAARAGEQGRGFAVVASEVRSLAQRSAVAAKEIKTLIGASVERVASGTQFVEGAGETMRALVVNAKRMNTLLNEISQAATEQSDGVAHVSQAVHDLDRTTQQNASLVEQTAVSASTLKDRAIDLAEEVSRFRLTAGTQ